MVALEVACDGGKDSLSMAAAAGGETVMCPGNLVVSAYVGCPDVTKVATPDLKLAGKGGVLLHVDLAGGADGAPAPGVRRLGGSALAQAYAQVGDESPDVAPASLRAMWGAVQALLERRAVSAGHDVSDGGIATTLLEMAFAGEPSARGGVAAWILFNLSCVCAPHIIARLLFAPVMTLLSMHVESTAKDSTSIDSKFEIRKRRLP